MTTEANGLAQTASNPGERPDLVAAGRGQLSVLERMNISLMRGIYGSPTLTAISKFLLRQTSARFVDWATGNLRKVYGIERLPAPETVERCILVSNHRSYFDLYIISLELMIRRLRARVVYPVRSNFFYDHPLGGFVNYAMSVLSMYPPIFRDRKRMHLNQVSMGEISWLMRNRNFGVGMHPEGKRNQGDDPYVFLPAKPGVGRLAYENDVPVLPVFINGLGNNLAKQVKSNFDGTGRPICIVFGKPLDMTAFRQLPPEKQTFQKIANATMDAIKALSEEERDYRQALREHPASR